MDLLPGPSCLGILLVLSLLSLGLVFKRTLVNRGFTLIRPDFYFEMFIN